MVVTAKDVRVIDTDSHIIESPDLWTSRIASKFHDRIPKIDINPADDKPHWHIGDHWLMTPGFYAQAGFDQWVPNTPVDYDDIQPGAWKADERLKVLDDYGIYAQVLYPNLIGFEAPHFMRMGDELSLLATRAYNDWLVEWASADPDRLIPIAAVPFWDVDESVKEMERAVEMGHRGILFANQYEMIGLPRFIDPHWDPIYEAAQALGISINFHVGFQASAEGSAGGMQAMLDNFDPRMAALGTSLGLMSNATSVATLVTSGLCDRFPELSFVSVESGFGYITYLMEVLDWHWKGYGAYKDSELLPSEYFRRQCYGSFWFERETLALLDTYPDNFFFETDYPHPTSLSPGPCSPADKPDDHIEKAFASVPDDIARKVLYENAARVYKLS